MGKVPETNFSGGSLGTRRMGVGVPGAGMKGDDIF